MAGKKGRSGGDRPRDQFSVSAVGGAGSKNGQPKRYIPGMKSLGSTGVETMAQQSNALMAETPRGPVPAMANTEPFVRRAPMGGTLMDDTTGPIGPVTAGVDFGPGVGSEALPKNISGETRPTDNMMIIKKYFPALLRASQLQDTPDSYKRFISYLSGQIDG